MVVVKMEDEKYKAAVCLTPHEAYLFSVFFGSLSSEFIEILQNQTFDLTAIKEFRNKGMDLKLYFTLDEMCEEEGWT